MLFLGLISWKIWTLSAGVPGVRDRSTHRVFEVVIETGKHRRFGLCFIFSFVLTRLMPFFNTSRVLLCTFIHPDRQHKRRV